MMYECTPEDLEKWADMAESLSTPRHIEAEGYRMAARTIINLEKERDQLQARLGLCILLNGFDNGNSLNNVKAEALREYALKEIESFIDDHDNAHTKTVGTALAEIIRGKIHALESKLLT